jgi:hypothetical protein
MADILSAPIAVTKLFVAETINTVAGEYTYFAASPDEDTVNDRREIVSNGILIQQICTVANATKGSGTWVEVFRVDTSGFQGVMYNDSLPSDGWKDASGGGAPDTASHTIAGLAVNFRCFDGNNTEEKMAGSFEIMHNVDIATLNADVIKAEIHAHIMATTTAAGVVKCFYDVVYQPLNAAPIALGTFSNLVTISANQQYFHKVGGVELTKPSSGWTIGDKLLVNFRRTPSDGQDTYPDDIAFLQCALHVPINSNGSRQRYIK